MLKNIFNLIERNLKLRVLPFMKRIYLVVFFTLTIMLQRAAQAQTVPAATTNFTSATVVSEKNVQSQQAFWKKQIKINPKNTSAWFQLYQWTERDKSLQLLQKQLLLEEIIKEVNKETPNTWTFYLIKYLHSGKEDKNSLNKAIVFSDNDALVMPYAIQLAIIDKDTMNQKIYGQRLQAAAPLSLALIQYHQNCLMSAEKNATIYAKGLNDLIPLNILQQIFGIRKDITLAYYTGKIEPQQNTYLCLTLGASVLKEYPNGMYTGLLVKILPDENSMDELEENIESQFNSTGFKIPEKLLPDEALIYKNYLPALITLYNKYKSNNESKRKKYEDWINRLSALTLSTTIVQNILAQ